MVEVGEFEFVAVGEGNVFDVGGVGGVDEVDDVAHAGGGFTLFDDEEVGVVDSGHVAEFCFCGVGVKGFIEEICEGFCLAGCGV